MHQLESSATGFTLLELAIVILLLGIALSAGAPYLRNYLESRSLDATVDTLVSQLDLARHRAVAENNPHRVLLNDPAEDRYQIHDDDDGDNALDDGEALYGPFTLPPGLHFQNIDLAGDGGLVFEPTGMLRPGQGGWITLADGRQNQLTLEVFASGITQRLHHQ